MISVTSYLITDIKYESDINLTDLLAGPVVTSADEGHGPAERNPPR